MNLGLNLTFTIKVKLLNLIRVVITELLMEKFDIFFFIKHHFDNLILNISPSLIIKNVKHGTLVAALIYILN